jgi:hypothetical protein
MGNGRLKRPRFPGLESRSIAHNEVAASAKFATVDARSRFPRKSRLGSQDFYAAPKKKVFGAPS